MSTVAWAPNAVPSRSDVACAHARGRRMGLLIRTSDLPAGRRRQAWREVVCDTLGPLEHDGERFPDLKTRIRTEVIAPGYRAVTET
jgi:hypothetical protein